MSRIERNLGFLLAVALVHGGAAAAQRTEPSNEIAWAGGAGCSQSVTAMQGLRDERGACPVEAVVVAQLDGSQTVTYQGQLMTMADLTKLLERLSDAERNVQVNSLARTDRILFREYLGRRIDADNKRIDAETARLVEDNKRIEAETARHIDRFASKVPEVVAGYEELLRRGQKLKADDARLLRAMLEYGKPPSFMARAEKLLADPNNFTGPEKSR